MHWELPADLPPVQVPALSIQPLVENAIRHGIEPSAEGGRVDIRVTMDRNVLTVAVSNDLPGDSGTASAGHRIGQASVRERIQALDPLRQGRFDTRVEDGRYIAVITLPLVAGMPGRPQRKFRAA